jgi:carbonic anhydrase/acetyltransferase-like protein (isoleucine patch superfamily)
VLHQAVIGEQALVGAGAVVSPRTEVPPRAKALGIPAKVRPDAVDPDIEIAIGAASYVERAKQYRADLRRLD